MPSCCFQQTPSVPANETFIKLNIFFCLYLAHEVWFVNPIISSTVLAEAEEDGVDGHPIDRDEAMGGDVGEYSRNKDGSPRVCHIDTVILCFTIFITTSFCL